MARKALALVFAIVPFLEEKRSAIIVPVYDYRKGYRYLYL
jgi:hypothetical protein